VKEVSVHRKEALLSQSHHPEPAIPDPILEEWQKIVNLMAEMLDVPAGLIMRIVGEDIQVFASSSREGILTIVETPSIFGALASTAKLLLPRITNSWFPTRSSMRHGETIRTSSST